MVCVLWSVWLCEYSGGEWDRECVCESERERERERERELGRLLRYGKGFLTAMLRSNTGFPLHYIPLLLVVDWYPRQ